VRVGEGGCDDVLSGTHKCAYSLTERDTLRRPASLQQLESDRRSAVELLPIARVCDVCTNAHTTNPHHHSAKHFSRRIVASCCRAHCTLRLLPCARDSR
jgi:hypothetical protein